MTDYSNMSDFYINCAVARLILGDLMKKEDIPHHLSICRIDYCNNPADAWPIIAENKINIDFRDSLKAGPMAKLCRDNGIYAVDKNPLRAAMIVFLMLKDAEKC